MQSTDFSLDLYLAQERFYYRSCVIDWKSPPLKFEKVNQSLEELRHQYKLSVSVYTITSVQIYLYCLYHILYKVFITICYYVIHPLSISVICRSRIKHISDYNEALMHILPIS